MEEMIIYLLKSAGLMSLFYAGYYFLLKNDTSFKTNRIFLIAGIITSLLLPFLEITRTVEVETSVAPFFPANLSAEVFTTPANHPKTIDWWQIAGGIYLLGLGFFLLKFLVELFSLLKLIFSHKIIRNKDHYLIQKSGNTRPFSFFKYIVLDPGQHSPAELDMILKHERSHVRQWHSVDQLLSSLSVCLFWFNPLSWLYRKSLVQNLEYLADKEVIAARVSKMEYQKTLLKISVSDFQPVLTNQFYQSFIKKRIMMLNKNVSQKSNFWKTSLILPFIFLFMITFNMKTVAQTDKWQVTGEVTEVSYSYQPDAHFAIITKEAKNEDLEKLKKDFSENEFILDFTNIERTSKGEINEIALSYQNKKNGTTGSYSQGAAEGIKPFTISIDNGKVSFKNVSETEPLRDDNATIFHEKINEKPLIIISGKEYNKDNLNGKTIWIKGEMNVLHASEASESYGNKANDGVILISEGEIIDNYQAHLKAIDSENKELNRKYIWIREGQKPFFATLINHKKNIIPDAEEIIAVQYDNESTVINTQKTRPLYVVNGEIQGKDFKIQSVQHEEIKSINILKDESAVEKYGEKGKKGVIEIVLKSKEELENYKNEYEKIEIQKDNKESISFIVKDITFDDSKGGKSSSISVSGVTSAMFDSKEALFVINGKEMDKDFDPDTISEKKIESITVLKGNNAIAKYGEKALNGAIEIITKK